MALFIGIPVLIHKNNFSISMIHEVCSKLCTHFKATCELYAMCMCKPPKGTGMCKQRLLHGFIQLGVCHTPVFCTENYPAKFFKNLCNNLSYRTSFVKSLY